MLMTRLTASRQFSKGKTDKFEHETPIVHLKGGDNAGLNRLDQSGDRGASAFQMKGKVAQV